MKPFSTKPFFRGPVRGYVAVCLATNLLLLGLAAGYVPVRKGLRLLVDLNATKAHALRTVPALRTQSAPGFEHRSVLGSEADPQLELVGLGDGDPKSKALLNQLKLVPELKVYVLAVFERKPSKRTQNTLRRRYGLVRLRSTSALRRSSVPLGLFYSKSRNLKNITSHPQIKSAHLLKRYTAKGFYSLNVVAEEKANTVEFSIHLPYSKPGKTLVERTISIQGNDDKVGYVEERNVLNIHSSLQKGSKISMLCLLKYEVDLATILEHDVAVFGNAMPLGDYRVAVNGGSFASSYGMYSEKIAPTRYASELSKRIPEASTIADAWGLITKELNRDTRYDHRKRRLFFSGQLAYTNIRDMYMSTQEFVDKRVGACPERSSLEVSILRNLGIPARTATRLYHVYAELYSPERGWISTSSQLQEIPLCRSSDEKQSYFASWKPEAPIRLKWEGTLLPLLAM